MKEEICLFIGGVLDGDTRPVPVGMPMYRAHALEDVPYDFTATGNDPVICKTDDYGPVPFQAGDMHADIYLLNAHVMAGDDAAKAILRALINGYRRPLAPARDRG